MILTSKPIAHALRATAVALALTLGLAACGKGAEQSNAYVQQLNNVITEINTLSTAPEDQMGQALGTAIPKMEASLASMQQAQSALTGAAQTIANSATPAVQTTIASLKALQSALNSGDAGATVQAAEDLKKAGAELEKYAQQWNSQVATQ